VIHRPRCAFTLVEALLSMVVLSIIVVACGSAMRLMSRGLAARDNTLESQTASGRSALDQIRDDLKIALTVPEQTATALTVTVPDRDGDGNPETIRYAWPGVAGAPLTRQRNGGTAISIADNVTSLNFQFLQRTVGPVPPVESAEQLLVSYDTGSSVKNFGCSSSNFAGQYFRPSLPANAVCWKVTRVKISAAKNGLLSGGNVLLDIKAADASQIPTGSSLDSGSAGLGLLQLGATWVEFQMSKLGGLDPNSGLCIVVSSAAASSNFSVQYTDAASSYPGSYSTSANGGTSWATPTGGSALLFYVYGTITTQP
jgi:type II secretory pathway pseudopilin PulG